MRGTGFGPARVVSPLDKEWPGRFKVYCVYRFRHPRILLRDNVGHGLDEAGRCVFKRNLD